MGFFSIVSKTGEKLLVDLVNIINSSKRNVYIVFDGFAIGYKPEIINAIKNALNKKVSVKIWIGGWLLRKDDENNPLIELLKKGYEYLKIFAYTNPRERYMLFSDFALSDDSTVWVRYFDYVSDSFDFQAYEGFLVKNSQLWSGRLMDFIEFLDDPKWSGPIISNNYQNLINRQITPLELKTTFEKEKRYKQLRENSFQIVHVQDLGKAKSLAGFNSTL